jgi:hypothetical protein
LVDDLGVVVWASLVPVAIQQYLDRDVGLTRQNCGFGRPGLVEFQERACRGSGLLPSLGLPVMQEIV